MWLYMLFLVAGILLGAKDIIPQKIVSKSSGFQFWSLLIILFTMGVGIGGSDDSVAFAAAAIIGSLVLVRLLRPLIGRGRGEPL
jgi:phosphotransferase system  glucose/maltose/N-acetylglucosamine-specific IIC component